jgi:hypothetical protein
VEQRSGLLFTGRGACGKIFYEQVVRKVGGERGFGDHVRWEMISSNYVERSGGGS